MGIEAPTEEYAAGEVAGHTPITMATVLQTTNGQHAIGQTFACQRQQPSEQLPYKI